MVTRFQVLVLELSATPQLSKKLSNTPSLLKVTDTSTVPKSTKMKSRLVKLFKNALPLVSNVKKSLSLQNYGMMIRAVLSKPLTNV